MIVKINFMQMEMKCIGEIEKGGESTSCQRARPDLAGERRRPELG